MEGVFPQDERHCPEKIWQIVAILNARRSLRRLSFVLFAEAIWRYKWRQRWSLQIKYPWLPLTYNHTHVTSTHPIDFILSVGKSPKTFLRRGKISTEASPEYLKLLKLLIDFYVDETGTCFLLLIFMVSTFHNVDVIKYADDTDGVVKYIIDFSTDIKLLSKITFWRPE